MGRLLFFFSSRRRHTRYWRDWSSDVCSSDLDRLLGERRRVAGRVDDHFADTPARAHLVESRPFDLGDRRVGAEARGGGGGVGWGRGGMLAVAGDLKKKKKE